MAYGARVGAAATREAEPAVRVLVVRAGALIRQRLADDDPECLGLLGALLAYLGLGLGMGYG